MDPTMLTPNLLEPSTSSLLSPVPPVPFSSMPVAPQRPEDDFREFGDTDKTRANIYQNVLTAAQGIEPIANERHTLRLTNVDYQDSDRVSKRDQKAAILGGLSQGRRLRGTWEMTDNATGEVIDRKRSVLMTVPHMTERGTFINRGSEYSLKNQQRLLPGVYTRVRDNGEIESHANIMPGKGVSHRYFLDPEKGVFKIRLGQGTISLMPLLKAMGVNKEQIKEAWGNELFASNYNADNAAEYAKLKGKFLSAKELEGDEPEQREALINKFANMELDPQVTQRTLGRPHQGLTLDAVLDITKKLVAVSRGKAEPDDRDALMFQKFVGPEDLFSERITRDKGGARRNLLWKMSGRGNLRSMPSSALNKQLMAALTTSGLGQALEEINPAEMFDKSTSVSRMGEGGIPSTNSIPMESRSVQPSMLGYIDPLRTPESGKVGVDTYLARGARKGRDGKLYSQFRDVRTGELTYKSPQDVADMTIAFPDSMDQPGKRVAAMRNGKMTYVPKAEVDLVLPAMEEAFNPLSNIIPMKSQVKGQRLVMASRMTTQALPIVDAEAPLVQSAIPGTEGRQSYEELYSNTMGALRATQGGVVQSVDDDGIHVRYEDGTSETHELYHNFPFNRKTFVHQTASVQPGDQFKPDQLLAYSNFTDKGGATALGRNARTAYIAWQGKNFEDAVVISEGFAKKMSSEHMYQHDLEVDDRMKVGKKNFIQLFPGKFDKATLARMDDNGIVKSGEQVNYGDPLILGASQKEAAYNKVHKQGQAGYTDATVLWEHHDAGTVTDVVMGKSGPTVVVKATSAMQTGDKLCYDEETEVLTRQGWINVAELKLADEICTLQPHDQIQYLPPTALQAYEQGGDMYRIKTQQVDQFVTVAHKMYVQRRGHTEFELLPAASMVGKRVRYKKNGQWIGNSPVRVVLEGPVVKAGQSGNGFRKLPDLELTTKTYLTLLGMYVSEGNLVDQPSSGSYGIDISQTKEPNRSQLYAELAELGINFNVHGVGTKVRIYSKTLMEHFKAFGCTAKDKRLPVEIFDWAREDLETLFKWLMWGDGHRHDTGRPVCYTTVSPQLADDVQRLCLHIGYAANVVNDLEATVQVIKGKSYQCLPRYNVRVVTKKLTPQVNHGHTKNQKVQEEYLVQGYDRPVYCVTVPGHVLYVRRNGKPCWSGNSGRYGDKGVIADIIPDDEMPHDGDNQPFEVLLNPLGVVTRTNPAQISELLLGKIAARRGKPIKVQDFDSSKDMSAWVLEELGREGLSDLEDILDPSKEQKIRDIATGSRFFMKLHHTAESKGQSRGGGSYTMDGSPAKGGADGSKIIGVLETNALLSHGATATLQDVSSVRGQKSDEYWMQFMSGYNPTAAKVPMVYQRFVAQLKASGVNVVKKGSQTNILALTDRDVDELAGDRELKSGNGVEWGNSLKEIPGGLFDKAMTGGHGGNKWTKIKLHEPMPNPVLEEPIRRILGLTKKEFNAVISGEKPMASYGSGPEALKKALGAINIPAELKKIRDVIDSGRKSDRDAAVRKLGYLKSAEKLGLKLDDYILSSVPVIPPMFRPVSMMGNKMPLISDANFLYKELFEANSNLKAIQGELGSEASGQERLATYNAFKAVTGLGDPIHQKTKDKNVKGLLQSVFGSSPKFSTLQRKLISTTVDNVGRAVITPNPDLDMDSVGLPEEKAFKAYDKFITRRLVRQGMSLRAAREAIANKTPLARKILLDEMEDRPVYISRAPVLHKFGIMAMKPQLTKGNTLQVSPLIVKGFGADFDGDAMNYHVPSTEKARKEAFERLLPSRNLFSMSDFKSAMHAPANEYVGGLHTATDPSQISERPVRIFQTVKDAKKAYENGSIAINDRVRILES